ncbi:hypothetical protein BDN70DRAFT_511102 [Pholiota conissans]|uniref:RRM domain-containing protein n=1 Tax=Pholiota conissans TaxID=109636 RepID=A0A9P6D319_9AGAR|nr:hypothetical protein BDN70DRAFT_511102 [Pholiota conissans]
MAFNPSLSTRAWGPQVDVVSPSAPLLTPIQIVPTTLSNNISETSLTTTSKDDKLPHHASVFVGSLPSNIDQGDLTRMLLDHLSEHTQVKNIKVVRDSKGGVCAFVQCEDANSAAGLIQTLHTGPPKLFLGRILRYEPARAFRTLLISYRCPTKFVRPNGMNNLISSPYQNQVELELPHAMRIWKHSNSRFHNIVYNSDAIHAEENSDPDNSEVCAPENSILLKPLEFNEDSLRKLVSFFGGLEKFGRFSVSKSDEKTSDAGSNGADAAYSTYPQPHNGNRAPTMDQGCWEVKWEHRDACVSALMTLRRVPHLTVTWAHQPASPNQPFSPSYHLNPSPSYSVHAHHRDLSSQFSVSPNGSTSAHVRCRPTKVGVETFEPSNLTTDLQHTLPTSEDGPKVTQCPPTSESDGAKNHDVVQETVEKMQGLDLAGDAAAVEVTRENVAVESATTREDAPNEKSQGNADISRNTDEAEAQDLYIPQTPALDALSVTPLTAGSQFPITPLSSAAEGHMFYDNFDAQDKAASFRGGRGEKEIDPTTLFVGGLEMFGPGAWDEEKVKNFFARFGGLESVKLVRPLNSCSAFAFVKFNNADSPARAVFEEVRQAALADCLL